MYAITSPIPQFFDLSGAPLDAGKIYIGTAGANPITTPVAVFWDDAGTQPAQQPIRTVSGFPARNGKPARVYVNADDFSMTVMTRADVVVTTELSVLSTATFRTELLSVTNELLGSKLIGWFRNVAGFIGRKVAEVLAEEIRATDFGADPTGAADSTGSIQAALNYAASAYRELYPALAGFVSVPLYSRVMLPNGTYKTGTLSIPVGVILEGQGTGTVLAHAGGGTDCIVITNNPDAVQGTDRFSLYEGVRNLTVLGSKNAAYNPNTYNGQQFAHATRNGVFVNGAFHHVVVENVHVMYCQTGFKSRYQVFGTSRNNRAQYCSGDSFLVEYASNVLTLENCVSYAAGGRGFHINNTGMPNQWNVNLVACDAEYSGREGLRVVDTKMSMAEGCYFELNNTGSRDGVITGEVSDVAFVDTSISGSNHILKSCFVNSIWSNSTPGTGDKINGVLVDVVGSVSIESSTMVNTGTVLAAAIRLGKLAKLQATNSITLCSGGCVPLRVSQATTGVFDIPIISTGDAVSFSASGGSNVASSAWHLGTRTFVGAVTAGQKIFQTTLNGAEISYVLGNQKHRILGDLEAGGTVDGQGVSLQRNGSTGGGVITTANGTDLTIVAGANPTIMSGATSFRAPASSTPPVSGDFQFERTSNTQITLKLRGTDGVVRSVALMLS